MDIAPSPSAAPRRQIAFGSTSCAIQLVCPQEFGEASRLERHRMVHAALGMPLLAAMHACTIKAGQPRVPARTTPRPHCERAGAPWDAPSPAVAGYICACIGSRR